MNPAALVIVLVGVGEAGSDWAAGALQTLREGLDRRVVIELRENLEPAAPEGAFVVSVEFLKGGRKATLKCLSPTGRADKELQFKKNDRPLDRGRAVGYALAALLPELRADALALPEPPPPAPEPELPPAPPPEAPPPPAPVEEKPAAPAPVVVAPAPAPAARGRVGLEASGCVLSSFVSRDVGYGAAIAVDVELVSRLSLRVGAGARFGNSPLPGASLRELGARLGLRGALPLGERLTFSVLGHGLLLRLDMALAGEALGRWQGGAEVAAELAFHPVRALALIVGLSGRTTFAGTEIYVGSQRVTAIPHWAFSLELGLRVWP